MARGDQKRTARVGTCAIVWSGSAAMSDMAAIVHERSVSVNGVLSRNASRWWFPELESVSFRIHHPAELAELRHVRLLIDVAAFATQHVEQGHEIGHAIVDHERRRTGIEVVGSARKDRPHRDGV